MSNVVEFVVKLRDVISGPMMKIAQTGNTSFNKLQQAVDKIASRSNVLKSSINDLDKQISKLQQTRAISVDGSQITRINREIDKLQAKKDKLEGRGGSTGGLSSFFRQGLAFAGIGGLAFLGKDIMQAGMERQMNLTALTTLLGQNAGTRVNSQLVNYAQRSIYGSEVFNEGKLMAASGMKADNIMPVMKMIGDIALGKKDRMESLALAFSEVSTRGSLNGMNERMFLQGGLFNPLEQLHKLTGKSMGQLKEDMAEGRIGINDLVAAMEYATGPMGRWYKAMEKMQNTPAGKWTAFTGTVSKLAGDIGLKLLPALGGVTDFLTWAINNKEVLYGIAAGIGAMTAAWALYTVWTERAAIWQGILEVIAWWPVAIIGTVIGLITYMCLKYKNWGDSMLQVWDIAKNVGLGIFDIFKFAGEDIAGVFELMGLKIKATFEFIGGMATNVGKAMKLALHGDFKLAGQALTAPIQTEAGMRANTLSAALAIQKASHTATLKTLFSASQLKGLDFSTNHPRKGVSPMAALAGFGGGGYTPDGSAGGTVPSGDTSRAITGGGVRSITINIPKFTDKIDLHSVNIKEGVGQLEEMLRDMFLRVAGSAVTQLN